MASQHAIDFEQLLEGTPYRAVGRLAGGGMGEIYEAVSHDSQEPVVVKLLREDLLEQADMFDRMRVEGEALALLDHPHIVAARGHGTTARGRPYVAMERLEGCTLHRELRRRGGLPLAEAVHHTRQLLSALRAVHDAGIVHRDVKPENVILCRPCGGQPFIKLLDFGVAKVEGGADARIAPLAIPTLHGACIGTPRYASPEQARGAVVDSRTDIYAAGILLYTLVAGRGPFDEIKVAGQILQAHISEEPPPPSRFTRYPIPAGLESVILRAIAKRADDRFADAASFSRELVKTLGALCLPVELVPTQREIALALTEQRGRADGDAGVTTVAEGPRGRQAPSDGRTRESGVIPRATPISVPEVLLSAAAFAAIAGGVAMWFVH